MPPSAEEAGGPWADGVHEDPVPDVVEGHRLRQAHDRELGGRVAGAVVTTVPEATMPALPTKDVEGPDPGLQAADDPKMSTLCELARQRLGVVEW